MCVGVGVCEVELWYIEMVSMSLVCVLVYNLIKNIEL